jgi:hypothetical protein
MGFVREEEIFISEHKLYKQFVEIVYNVLRKEKLIGGGSWHVGTVDEVISDKRLRVFVDGNDVSQIVSCNPDIAFSKGDEVWIIFVNKNPIDKFVLSKRAV